MHDIEEIEPRGFWMQPEGYYFAAAMGELGLDQSDLEKVDAHSNIAVGDYPVLDSVYEKAWELHAADEAD